MEFWAGEASQDSAVDKRHSTHCVSTILYSKSFFPIVSSLLSFYHLSKLVYQKKHQILYPLGFSIDCHIYQKDAYGLVESSGQTL
jgi:hypothetical protein